MGQNDSTLRSLVKLTGRVAPSQAHGNVYLPAREITPLKLRIAVEPRLDTPVMRFAQSAPRRPLVAKKALDPLTSVVFQEMLRIVCAQTQILWSIIFRIAVKVMNNLGGGKIATKLRLHYQAVLSNVACFHRMRVIWSTLQQVRPGIDSFHSGLWFAYRGFVKARLASLIGPICMCSRKTFTAVDAILNWVNSWSSVHIYGSAN